MNTRTRRIKRGWRWVGWSLLVLMLIIAARAIYAFRDRYPNYRLNVTIDPQPAMQQPKPLQVGFGREKINPDLSNPQRPIWVAGFSQHRAATAVHDDLWAIACVLDDGHTRVGFVSLDAIGFFHDDVLAVRQQLSAEWRLHYIVITSTHNHNTPDLLGLWGPNYLRTGVDARYRAQVRAACVTALGQAVQALQPARVAVHEIPTLPDNLLADTRKPIVYDPDIRVLHFTSATNHQTVGVLVGWANHPETVWSRNTELTADFPGYLRDALVNGVREQEKVLASGVGGVAMYVNGAVGGLMSTTPKVTVRDPYLSKEFQEPTHEKARALGRALAARILPVLTGTNVTRLETLPIGIRARTLNVPLSNKAYLLAGIIGLLDRGYAGWMTLRTEVAMITLGEVSIACVPGEIYPEIVNGGIENDAGGDFQIPPVEVPPIREFMPGKTKLIFGLANDEIGYLIPKSQWDVRPPFAYGAKKAVYGEINSVGPDAAPVIHGALRDLCRQ